MLYIKARRAFLFTRRTNSKAMRAFISYLKNVQGELKHVVWPKRNTAIVHTIIIILISAFVALYISGLDYIFTSVVNRLVSGY